MLLYSQRFLRYSRRKIGDHREVPRADRFMKIYINHPQATCFHPVKWRFEIPSRLGGVRRQRISSDHHHHQHHTRASSFFNKIREPNDWTPICSIYIKSNNISDLALFQGLIQALVCPNRSSRSRFMAAEGAT